MTEPQDDAPIARDAAAGAGADPTPPEDEATTLRLLEPHEILARRRPRAIFFVWGWELVCALLVATPIHAWAKAVFDAHPDGDAVIFRPGGHALLSWLGEDTVSMSIVVGSSLVALLVLGVLGQFVTGALVAALATGGGKRGAAPKAAFALRAGAASFFPLLGVGVVATAIETFVVGIGLFAAFAVDRSVEAASGDARAFTVSVAVFAVFAAAALVVGVTADLARVAIASAKASALLGDAGRDADERAWGAARRIRGVLGRAVLGWSWRAALSIGLVYLGARAGDVAGGRGGLALWLLFAFHQLILFARAGLRASWLANALRLVARRDVPMSVPAPAEHAGETAT